MQSVLWSVKNLKNDNRTYENLLSHDQKFIHCPLLFLILLMNFSSWLRQDVFKESKTNTLTYNRFLLFPKEDKEYAFIQLKAAA